MNLYRPLEAAPGALRFKLFHRGAPVPLSDSLPMLERMGLNVLDERPHRVAPRDMAPGLDARLRHAVGGARRRGRDRRAASRCSRRRSAHLPRRGRERRFQPAGARRAASRRRDRRCCAPTRSTCARSASRCRRRSSKPRSPRMPSIARPAGRAVQAALRSRRCDAGAEGAPSRCARSRTRSRGSTTCPRTACCASTWR